MTRTLGRVLRALPPVLLAALLGAPAGAQPTSSPVTVPVIISLTGPFALVGSQERLALETYMKSANANGGINGHPLVFDFQDDASNPAQSVLIANRLIAERVPLIVGPNFVATCRAVAPLVTHGPVQYCMSAAGPTPKNGFSFTAGYSTFDSARTGLAYFRYRQWHRLAILAASDATGQDGEHALDEALALPENHSLSVVAREHFNLTDISVAAQVARIEAAKPDVLFAWTTGTPLGTLLHGLQYAGYDVPVYASSGNLSYVTMGQIGDLAPSAGLFFCAPRFLARDLLHGAERSAVDTFVKAFTGAGVRPDAVLSIQWDVGVVVADALRHVGPNPTSERIQRYIEGIHGLPGASATFDFRDGSQRGITSATLLVARWDTNSKTFVAVSRPGGAQLPR